MRNGAYRTPHFGVGTSKRPSWAKLRRQTERQWSRPLWSRCRLEGGFAFVCSARCLARLFVLLLWACTTSLAGNTLEWDDEVGVALTHLGFDGTTMTFDVSATVTNTSHEVWVSPVTLVLSTIVGRGPSLVNAIGHTAEGFPFVDVPIPAAGVAPGESVSN